MNTFAYLFGSLLLLFTWLALFWARPQNRREMLLVSLATLPLGLTELLFVPRYWQPPTLFDLARRTGWDLESLLFSFSVGGVASVLYEALTGSIHRHVNTASKHLTRHWIHPYALASPVIVFVLLEIFVSFNPIYSAILALVVGAIVTALCRPDLIRSMIISSFLFLTLYALVFFLSFVLFTPSYVAAVWNLPALIGILLLGIPIEELGFAAALGAIWSGVYEHIFWYRLTPRKEVKI